MDNDGSGVFPKQKVRKLYNEKYQKTYSNRYYILKKDYIKDTRMRWKYSGRKQRAAGFVYLKGYPYRGAEGSSQLRSCLNDAIINADPRIREKLTNWNFIESVHLEK